MVEPVRTTDILFLNPTMQPAPSSSYGARARGFFVSPIMSFNGKMWQLRTVRLRGQHYVAPFMINGGGITARQPILAQAFVAHIGGELSNVDKALAVESPLGDLTTFSPWDDVRADDATIVHNLIGHGLADLLQKLEFAAFQSLRRNATSHDIRDDLMFCAKPDVLRCLKENQAACLREIDAMQEAARRSLGDLRDVPFEEYAARAGWLVAAAAPVG